MTNEEVERAIDFLLRSQANSEARIEQTNEQLNRLAANVDTLTATVVELAGKFDQMSFQLGSFAGTQVELMRVLTKSLEEGEQFRESQKRINEAQMRVNEALVNSHTRAEEAQARINESLRATQARAEESQARVNESQARVNESLAAGQARTEEALAQLADAQAQSERRLEALTKIVEEERRR